MSASDLLTVSPVIPVVVIDDLAHAVPVARALVAGGIEIIELTLRTPVALDAIKAIATEVPEILVGAGTVTTPDQAAAATAAGSQFLVSPGATETLLAAMAATGLPYLPGVATVSEALAARERGLSDLKFFPAEASGGAPFLAGIGGPLPDLRFCPTGGIKPETAPGYRDLPNVPCVGGTWLTPKALLVAEDWVGVQELAAQAV